MMGGCKANLLDNPSWLKVPEAFLEWYNTFMVARFHHFS